MRCVHFNEIVVSWFVRLVGDNIRFDAIYSQLSLSRSRRDPLKHFEISYFDISDVQN